MGHVLRKPSAILTNSWQLYQDLHEQRGVGAGSADEQQFRNLGARIRASGEWAKWAPGLCVAIGKAMRAWINQSEQERKENAEEGMATLRALTEREREFRRHCEEGHMVFRKDCKACLQGQMRSHVHRRQKHHGSNTFCLNMDLVGPWKPGKDHALGRPATRFLIASLTVPLSFGKVESLEEPPDNDGGDQVESRDEGDVERVIADHPLDLDFSDLCEENPECERDPSPEEFKRRQRLGDLAWQREADKLQEPVPVHDLIFCEPLVSKTSSEVLRAIQRVWVRILGLGLTVRRLHSDGGREFCNKALDAWALARDLPHTFSVPSDPKSNGRIENWVKHAKAGIRTLLCSEKDPDTTQWPSALRQWAEQRLRKSLKLLSVPDPIRPLPPFGTKVMIKNRQWSRKTPHDPKAMTGKVLCPAANIPNASVLVLDNGQFYVAPVVYRDVLEPVSFQGEIADDVPPPPPRRVRGKTSRATLGRGESGFEVEGLEGFEDPVLDDGDEFEGMVPDSVLFGDDGGEGVSVRNLWCEEVSCKLCETPRTSINENGCVKCGTWQGAALSLEESEREATRLLEIQQPVSRSDINSLLRTSMQGWIAKSRPCDREAGSKGTSGWTLGHYVYGSKVGITKETYRRPQLTKLLNRYLRQNVEPDISWTAIRVTCDYEAGPHKDCNQPGSLNVVVPISWFDQGQVWIAGNPPSNEDRQELTKDIHGCPYKGYLIGGAKETACFDPRTFHAVESAVGSRTVLVGYTPRLLDRASETTKSMLLNLGFRPPSIVNQEQPRSSNGVTAVDTAGDPQGGSREEDNKAGVSPGGDGSNKVEETELKWRTGNSHVNTQQEFLEVLHDQYMSLRRLEMEARKYFDEELEVAAEQGWTAGTAHLVELKHWIQELEQWIVAGDASSRLRGGVENSF